MQERLIMCIFCAYYERCKADAFFQSIGMWPMTDKFWDNSVIEKKEGMASFINFIHSLIFIAFQLVPLFSENYLQAQLFCPMLIE